MERPEGAAIIHITHHTYPLKVYLVLVFGLVMVAVAFGGMGWTASGTSSSVLAQPTEKRPILIVLTVKVDRPVTTTPTPTRTMMPFELTVQAQPTGTPTPYLTATIFPTRTPLPPIQNLGSDTEGESGT